MTCDDHGSASPGGPGTMPVLHPADFDALRAVVRAETGIALSDAKRALLASRLGRRLRALGFASYGEYRRYVETPAGRAAERIELINAVTTNKTHFFREPHHFALLREVAAARRGPLRVWSAGCSTGEEPYSIAMTVLAAGPRAPGSLEIRATDIDTDVLGVAAEGIYAEAAVADVPTEWLRRFFLIGRGERRGHYRIRPEVSRVIRFERLNFVDTRWAVPGTFDLIFCRNVVIYFDRETQGHVFRRLAQRLKPGGHLLVGHSELVPCRELLRPVDAVPTAYQLVEGAGAAGPVRTLETARPRAGQRQEGSARAVAARRPSPVSRVAATATRVAPVHGMAVPGWAKAHEPPAKADDAPGVRAPLAPVSITVGGVHVSATPSAVRTLLGSCVAVCLYDPEARIGGMNHFLLPAGVSEADLPTRYGVHAMEVLINEIMRQGGDRRRLRAKAFGGAEVLDGCTSVAWIGAANAEFVKGFLKVEGIPLEAHRLGGTAPVEVMFHTHTGRAFVRVVGHTRAEGLARDEERAAVDLRRSLEAEADVTWF